MEKAILDFLSSAHNRNDHSCVLAVECCMLSACTQYEWCFLRVHNMNEWLYVIVCPWMKGLYCLSCKYKLIKAILYKLYLVCRVNKLIKAIREFRDIIIYKVEFYMIGMIVYLCSWSWIVYEHWKRIINYNVFCLYIFVFLKLYFAYHNLSCTSAMISARTIEPASKNNFLVPERYARESHRVNYTYKTKQN